MQRTAVRELLKVTADPRIISFAGGLPAAELFPIDAIREAFAVTLERQAGRALQYGETEGIPELRDWIAASFRRPGFPVSRANVLITSGAQQALDLLGRIFLDPGDAVAVESPTYLALLSAWRAHDIDFCAVPSDADGLCVDQLDGAVPARTKLLYLTPNFQNPQGTSLATARRGALLELARRRGFGVIEDDPYGELRFEGDAQPRLVELDAQPVAHRTAGTSADAGLANVIHVGTFSKVLVPGLRVGWLIAAEEVVEKLVQAKQAADLHTSSLSQHLILELLQAGVLERQIPRLRQAYRERRDAMLAALARHFPPAAHWTRPAGGMFLLATLPGKDAGELLTKSLKRQVAFVPGAEFHLNGQGRDTLRLNFSNTPTDRIEEGIRRLGALC